MKSRVARVHDGSRDVRQRGCTAREARKILKDKHPKDENRISSREEALLAQFERQSLGLPAGFLETVVEKSARARPAKQHTPTASRTPPHERMHRKRRYDIPHEFHQRKTLPWETLTYLPDTLPAWSRTTRSVS